MQFLRQYIESMIEIDDNDWQQAKQLFTKQTFAKGDTLFHAGEVCQTLFYVSEGVVRAYSITTEGKELTWMVNYQKKGYQHYQYATVLGITPQSLSRIKNNL